jgi:hypothetical protein
MSRNFFKEVMVEFLASTNFCKFYVLKLLFINFFKILRFVNYSCKNLVFLLKHRYANLSSNIT